MFFSPYTTTITARWLLVFLSLTVISIHSKAQSTSDALAAHSWFYKENIGDSCLYLKNEKPGNEMSFSRSGRLVNKSERTNKRDSSYRYTFKKQELILNLNTKDSVKTMVYKIRKGKTPSSYDLVRRYSSVYKKRKGDDTIVMPELTLIRGDERRTIRYGEDVTIFSEHRALRNDSIQLAVWGEFIGYKADTILIDCDQYVEHNFYKSYKDSMHYIAPVMADTVIRIKLSISHIMGIYKEREPFGTFMTRTTIAGMSVGLACMLTSLISGENDVSAGFAQAAAYSFLTVPVSFGVGIAFSKQKFRITGGKDPKKLWRIQRHMPRPQVKGKR